MTAAGTKRKTLDNDAFSISVNDSDGSVDSIVLKGDAAAMNWLPTGADWFQRDKAWGLGFVTLEGDKFRWQRAAAVREEDGALVSDYRLQAAADGASAAKAAAWGLDKLTLSVFRSLRGDAFEERYVFRNEAEGPLYLDELALYSTFCDEYPVVQDDILSRRAHMHIWAGGAMSYIRCVRMSGAAPHLALIAEAGEFTEYHIEDKRSSNHRGAVALVSRRVRIAAAGGRHELRRAVVPYTDEADFHRRLTERTGYPHLEFDRLAAPVGETIAIAVIAAGALEKLTLAGREYRLRQGERLELRIERPGELTGRLHYGGGRIAFIRLLGLPPVEELLTERANFIVRKQQLRDGADPRNGAFLPYDREAERQLRVEDIEDTYGSVPDYNDARERLGMGAFLAGLYRRLPSAANMNALTAYRRFVKRELIADDGSVWDSCFKQQSARHYGAPDKEMTFRGYNYFFLVAFLSEWYSLTGEREALDDIVRVLRRYFAKFPLTDLAFGIDPAGIVQSLREAGMEAEATELTARFADKARAFARMDDRYEPSEVNYEQSTVAGVTMFLLDVYRLTGEADVLAAGKRQLRLLEGFDGCQPDYRMHSVGLRHWDGYWFGQYELWGDTLPHHWSALSAYAYNRFYEITGDAAYRDKALRCLNANLCLFRETGEANNTFVYPHKTNGRPGHLYDPICNDQDWSLFYYLKIMGARQHEQGGQTPR